MVLISVCMRLLNLMRLLSRIAENTSYQIEECWSARSSHYSNGRKKIKIADGLEARAYSLQK
jgi:hypothetical protein